MLPTKLTDVTQNFLKYFRKKCEEKNPDPKKLLFSYYFIFPNISSAADRKRCEIIIYALVITWYVLAGS